MSIIKYPQLTLELGDTMALKSKKRTEVLKTSKKDAIKASANQSSKSRESKEDELKKLKRMAKLQSRANTKTINGGVSIRTLQGLKLIAMFEDKTQAEVVGTAVTEWVASNEKAVKDKMRKHGLMDSEDEEIEDTEAEENEPEEDNEDDDEVDDEDEDTEETGDEDDEESEDDEDNETSEDDEEEANEDDEDEDDEK